MKTRMETLSFDSDSLEDTEAFLSSAYTPMRIGGPTEDTRARIERRAVGTLTVDRLSFGYDMGYDAGSLGRVCLLSVHSGTLVDRTSGREEVFGPGETFLLAPPDQPYRGEVRSARYTIAMFDLAVLEKVAGNPPDAGPVRLTGARPVTPAADRQLADVVAYLRDGLLDNPAAWQSPLVVASAVQHLAAATLAALPNSTQTPPTRRDSRDGGNDTLRRATVFVDEHAHEDIGLDDIARAAGVTPRALQYAFRRHAGTTPMAHLRTVRLDLAHKDLLAADPATATVTGIAARWGFWHPGHFADHYRRAYGQGPGRTLRG
ncbi:AraC family transcriptional regulator [Streptacidiphilus melanogenes]|uniref:AraC family transcriptional regulator n=1 Tax=Streptacidiphilus melanogenes TaxID=411235 RepID=UPI000B300516|nr:helix-turn-helix transcriptional regulator [Streptacidiphilus melanogenes]